MTTAPRHSPAMTAILFAMAHDWTALGLAAMPGSGGMERGKRRASQTSRVDASEWVLPLPPRGEGLGVGVWTGWGGLPQRPAIGTGRAPARHACLRWQPPAPRLTTPPVASPPLPSPHPPFPSPHPPRPSPHPPQPQPSPTKGGREAMGEACGLVLKWLRMSGAEQTCGLTGR